MPTQSVFVRNVTINTCSFPTPCSLLICKVTAFCDFCEVIWININIGKVMACCNISLFNNIPCRYASHSVLRNKQLAPLHSAAALRSMLCPLSGVEAVSRGVSASYNAVQQRG